MTCTKKRSNIIFLLDSAGICGRPRTSPGVRLLGNSYLDGDRVTFFCDKNLDLFGKAELRCVGRAWDSSEPECKGEYSFELMPCKKKKERKKKRRSLINMPNPFQIHPNPLFFNFAVFFSLQLLFINLSFLQSLIKLVSDNFIRDKEEAKKQHELKMSIQTRIMRGLKLATQAFNPIISPFKC